MAVPIDKVMGFHVVAAPYQDRKLLRGALKMHCTTGDKYRNPRAYAPRVNKEWRRESLRAYSECSSEGPSFTTFPWLGSV